MPLNPELLEYARRAAGEPRIDEELRGSLDRFKEQDRKRREYLRDKFAWGLTSSNEPKRLRTERDVRRLVTDPYDQQLLVEEVTELARKKEAARKKLYYQPSYAGRFTERLKTHHEAITRGFVGLSKPIQDWTTDLLGQVPTQKQVQFVRALRAAKERGFPTVPQYADVSQKAAGAITEQLPNWAATWMAASGGGFPGIVLLQSLRAAPERMRTLIEQGADPKLAAAVGLAQATAEGYVEAAFDPFLYTKGTGVLGKALSLGAQTAGELGEESVQAGIETGGQYLVGLLPGVTGPEAADIPKAMWTATKESILPVLGMGLIGGGGRVMAESDLRRVSREMLQFTKEGKVPSRKKFREWGYLEKDTNRQFRKDKMMEVIDALHRQDKIRAVVTQTPPTEEQWADWGLASKRPTSGKQRLAFLTNVLLQEAETRAAAQAQQKAAEGAPAEEVAPEAGVIPGAETTPGAAVEGPGGIVAQEAQVAADAARREQGGFLAEETGAAPIGGVLEDVPGVVSRFSDDELRARMKRSDPEVERRIQKSKGLTRATLKERIERIFTSAGRVLTRAQEFLPNTPRFAVANESLRLLKAVAPSSQDEAIRVVAAILHKLSPAQMELFENFLLTENQLAALDLAQTLRFGAQNRAAIEAYRDQIAPLVAGTPEVGKAIELRAAIVEETVKRLNEFNLLPGGAPISGRAYWHQQVLFYQIGQALGSRAGLSKKKRAFMWKRVEAREGTEGSLGEEYDYNTSYIEAEVAWLSDAYAEIHKAELRQKLEETYDTYDAVKRVADAEGISIREAVRRTEGVELYVPPPGHVFYPAFSIPEKIVEQLQAYVLESAEITAEDLRSVLAIGGPAKPMVLPTELVDQLESMEKPAPPHWLDTLIQAPIRAWKAWVTAISPKRILGYNFRNLTGDLDPCFAALPSIRHKVPRAYKELLKRRKTFLALSPEMRSARNLAVTSSGFMSHEGTKIGELPVFRRLTGEVSMNPWKWYTEKARALTEDREDLLRYAAFLQYRELLRSGLLRHYGASKKEVVDEIHKRLGLDAAAAHLARNLLGDYGNLTVFGAFLSKRLLPFWAFQEINIKRYPRLLLSAIESGKGTPQGALVSTVAVMRLAGLYAGWWAWNNLAWPALYGAFGGDDEDRDFEGDLAPYDRANPHIRLGENADGSSVIFRNVGALGDWLEWFGVNEALAMAQKVKNGQVDGWDVVSEMGKGALEKAFNLIRPDITGLFEVTTGQSLFPSVFQPRSIERGEVVANTFGLVDEYRWMKGKIIGKGNRARPHYWQRWFFGVSDPKQVAYGEICDLRNTFLAQKGAPEKGVYPISQYKQAREAAKAEDYDAFVEWKEAFVEANGHGSWKKFKAFLGRLDPISARLNDRDEREFELSFLSNEQRAKLRVARDYAHELKARLLTWWTASSLPPE